MSTFNLKINKFFLLLLVLTVCSISFFTSPETARAECQIKSAQFSPYGEKNKFWYSDATPPDVQIDVVGVDCAGQKVEISIVEADFKVFPLYSLIDYDDDIKQLDNKEVTFPTSDTFSIKLTAGETECEWKIFGDECNYYIKIYKAAGGDFTSDELTKGELHYPCDGVCDEDWVVKEVILPEGLSVAEKTKNKDTKTSYTFLEQLPGLEEPLETKIDAETNPCPFGKYLQIMINLIIGICAVLAFVMVVMGGIQYMTSELASSKEAGKDSIKNALLGLTIALSAWLILNTLNPNLLKLCLNKLPEVNIVIKDFEVPAKSTFDGKPIKVNFNKEAYPAALFASEKTGVETAFILAIFAQETSGGVNTGSCNYLSANMGPNYAGKPTQLETLKEIATLLLKDYRTINMSCSGAGSLHGGAIGLTQFIPSTWWQYRGAAKTALGHEPNPWDIGDALMMTAVKLKADGGISDQNGAACKYFGSCNVILSCGKGVRGTYGQCVLGKKISIQQQIDEAKRKGEI